MCVVCVCVSRGPSTAHRRAATSLTLSSLSIAHISDFLSRVISLLGPRRPRWAQIQEMYRCEGQVWSWHACVVGGTAVTVTSLCVRHASGIEAFTHHQRSCTNSASGPTAGWTSLCTRYTCRPCGPLDRPFLVSARFAAKASRWPCSESTPTHARPGRMFIHHHAHRCLRESPPQSCHLCLLAAAV